MEALEQPHEKNGPVLQQNVAPTPLGTHEHSSAHFSILRLRTPKQGVKARSPKGFRAATRTERRGPRDWHLAQAKMHIL